MLGGYGTAATGVIPSLYQNLTFQPADGEAYNFDLAEANRLLDEAGYKDSDGDKVREMLDGGRPLRFRLFARQESNTPQQSVQFMQGYCATSASPPSRGGGEPADRDHRPGRVRHVRVGLGGRARPRLLSTFTCGSRSYKSGGDVLANLSDFFYCNKEYDKLYEQQKLTIDPAKRAEIVKQMQRMLYVDAPYVVTFYYDELQAYRSDRFAGFAAQPDPGGVILFQYGTYSYRNIATLQATAALGDDGGMPLVPIAVGVAVVGAAGVLLALAREVDPGRARVEHRPDGRDLHSDLPPQRRPAPDRRQAARGCAQPRLRAGVQLLPVPGPAWGPGQEPHPQPPDPGRAGPSAQRVFRWASRCTSSSPPTSRTPSAATSASPTTCRAGLGG